MQSAPALDPDATIGGAQCCNAVCVGVVDVAGLSAKGLRAQLQLVGRGESRLAAMKAQILGELGRRTSAVDAQLIASDELLSSKREAKRDVETATRLQQLPDTSNALADGEIPAGHARLIARASSEGPVDEVVLVEAARTENYDRFAKTVRRHQQDRSGDDGQGLLDRQRQRRSARIFESPETGMFVLSAQFDRITGTRIATALTAKERELWHREDPSRRCTPQQRMADALAELICDESNDSTDSTTNGKGKKRRKKQGTNLLVLADFDVIKQQLVNARLADGTPIPVTELRDLAVDAEILPSIFDADTQNLWLGRSRRTASEAQRMALTARDEHCIGCEANPLWCRVHHIVWWSKNGPTDLGNLLLVCDACHHKIHDQGWQVHQHPTTKKFYLKPPPNPD
ncbi:MAG: DUF222 domain-containing protein [Acidimicrobiaceae bacterium]|nr:HNH endonuclease [Acidimicrobiia bacterium]MCY4494190.1 DUF222 domain-containing protein [Acidimicrobiaceae bacterium]